MSLAPRQKYLNEGEILLDSAKIYKGSFYAKKKRLLLLTESKRLVWIDYENDIVKGSLDVNRKSIQTMEAKGNSKLIIKTVRNV